MTNIDHLRLVEVMPTRLGDKDLMIREAYVSSNVTQVILPGLAAINTTVRTKGLTPGGR
jgi:hypothetical protein